MADYTPAEVRAAQVLCADAMRRLNAISVRRETAPLSEDAQLTRKAKAAYRDLTKATVVLGDVVVA